jgi:hypothetical protein
MQRMHSAREGFTPNLPQQPPRPRFDAGQQPPSYNNGTIGDEVDDLINSVTGQGAYSGVPRPQPPSQRMPPGGEENGPAQQAAASSSEQATAAPETEAAPFVSDPTPMPASDATPKPTAAKKSKKDKKGHAVVKLIYSDNATSPEEKMAKSQRYFFDRYAATKTEFVAGEPGEEVGGSGTVTGEMASDTVRDPQDTHPGG